MEMYYNAGNFIAGPNSEDLNIATDGTVYIRALSSGNAMIEAIVVEQLKFSMDRMKN